MKTDRKSRTSNRKTPLVAGLVLALGLFTGNGNAQWIVNDPMVNGTSIADMAQTWTEFVEQANRWQRQISEFQDALTQVTSIMQNPSSLMPSGANDMKEVAETAGDDVHCPAAGGMEFSLAGLFSAILPSIGGNLVEKQNKLCLQANHLRNMKYNEAVRMVEDTRKRSEKLTALINEAKGSKTEGAYRAAMLSGQVLIASTLVDMQYSKVRLEAYDTMIVRVEHDSNALAKQMMEGKKNQNPFSALITDVVSTAVLADALDDARTKSTVK